MRGGRRGGRRRRTSGSASTSSRWSTRRTGDWAIGEERYDALLREAEGLGYGTRELRDKGQAAYDELAADMRGAGAGAARRPTTSSPWSRASTTTTRRRRRTMLALYREATDAARAFCVEHELVTMPTGERCDVVPSAPFSRAMLAVAHYMHRRRSRRRAADRGVGHFFVPYPPDGATPEQVDARLATNNRHGAWSIAVHEAYPGHHWHLAWLAVDRGRRRRPRRCGSCSARPTSSRAGASTPRTCCASRASSARPEQELCQRDFRLFRAARIIVDTSLHLGEMTVEEAVDFMSTKASLSPGDRPGRGAALLRVADPGVVVPHRRPGDRPDAAALAGRGARLAARLPRPGRGLRPAADRPGRARAVRLTAGGGQPRPAG